MRWRVRFRPSVKAGFVAGPWETVVEHKDYQQAVVMAGRELCEGRKGDAANRLYWTVSLIEQVPDETPS